MALFFYQFTPLYGHNPFEAAHPIFEVSGRQKSHIPPGFCLLFLEIQGGLRAKSRFLRFARNRKDDSRILLSQMD